jgi:hypothetical protein
MWNTEIGLFLKIFLTVYFLLLSIIFLGVLQIIVRQLFYIINETTFIERKKKFNMETYYCYKYENNEPFDVKCI